jgi:hypothetical protein
MRSLASFADDTISARRLRKLAQQGRIKDAQLISGTYFVPSDKLTILPPNKKKN